MVSITTEEDQWGSKFIMFSVPLPDRPPVFMSMKVTDYNSEKSGVVIVDSEKFLQFWRNAPNNIHRAQANGNPQTWPTDRKYSSAADGFVHGHDNPVPLAYVSYGAGTRTVVSYKFLLFGKIECQEQFHHVGITNGVTRTIWLLAQGCKAFPIECEMPGARELYRLAAAPETSFHTVGELAKVAQHA